MSTTPEQLRIIIEAIGEFMRSRGHNMEVNKRRVRLVSSTIDTILRNEFEGSKWTCSISKYTYPINLVEPGSLEKMEKVILHCGKLGRNCRACPAFDK